MAAVLVGGEIIYVLSHPNDPINWGYVALVFNTAIVFGCLIVWFREGWKALEFWATLVVMLLAHTAAYVFILNRIHFPLMYYILLNSMELVVFSSILRRVAGSWEKAGSTKVSYRK